MEGQEVTSSDVLKACGELREFLQAHETEFHKRRRALLELRHKWTQSAEYAKLHVEAAIDKEISLLLGE